MIRRALLALLFVLAPGAVLAGDLAHVARRGDTPVLLARTYHVSVAAILAHNKGLDPCHIKIGDVILVPAPDATGQPPAPATAPKSAMIPDEEPVGVRYVVIPGDNPAAIADRFGIPLDLLSQANPGIDPKTLAVGRVLSIPHVAACPPPAVPVTRPGDQTTNAPLVTDFQ